MAFPPRHGTTPDAARRITDRFPLLGQILPFLYWLPEVDRQSLRHDFIAGLTGAVIVLPQGVAYALIAGLPPEYGLYTAIVTPVVAGLFGSSRHLVSGPTAAISIIVFSVVSGVVSAGSAQFVAYALTLTLMAGAIQLALGLARMGTLVNFISHSVVVGFTTGAAVLIGVSQIPHFLGLDLAQGESLLASLRGIYVQIADTNAYVLAVGAVTLASTLLVRWLRPTWPAMLLGMVIGSAFCWIIDGGERGVTLLGAMPGGLPPFVVPTLSPDVLRELAPGALAVAIIALIEAASIARAVATRSYQRIDGNQEFIGQGLSNVVGSFFSCYAGSGSFTRTGANYAAGARTPLAAVFAAALLALILLIAPDMTALLPMPAMAATVLLIAWNLVDIPHLRMIMRSSRRETLVLAATFLATLLLALEFAVYVGVLLSLVLYLQHAATPRIVPVAPVPERPGRSLRNAGKRGLLECPQLRILRIDGSLFFGAVDHVQRQLERERQRGYAHVLLVGSGVDLVDIAGAEMLHHEAAKQRALGGGLYLCSFKDHALDIIGNPTYLSAIGPENIFSSPKEAIHEIFERLDDDRCATCVNRIFRECATIPQAPTHNSAR